MTLRQLIADVTGVSRSLPDRELQAFVERCQAIDRATPDWVRRCRAANHNVVMLDATKHDDGTWTLEWFCTCCGKDRK
jgi:hypothetical protein